MGITKKELFTLEQNRISELAKAVAHPARIAILQYLLKTNACVCGDIVDEIPLSQSTISQHLAALKKSGIIQGDISGTSVCYCINPEVWEEANNLFNTFFKDPNGCC